jgi:hypothetical protein
MNKTIVAMSMIGAMVGTAVEPTPTEVVDDSLIREITMQAVQPEERQHQFSINLSYGISNNSENELYDCNMGCFELEYANQFAAFRFRDVGEAFVYAVVAGDRVLLNHDDFLRFLISL